MGNAGELHQRAVTRVNAGDFDGASALLAEARKQTDDPDLTARIELTAAFVESETGHPDAALRRCRALLRRRDLDRETRGLVWSQRALLDKRIGAATAALHDFAQAIDLLQDSPAHLGRALLNRGNLHLQRGSAEEAAADLTQALDIIGATEDSERIARAEHNLGYARLLTGDLVGALQMMDAAREVLAPLSPVSRAVGEQDRAEVLTAAGRGRDAVTPWRPPRRRTASGGCAPSRRSAS